MVCLDYVVRDQPEFLNTFPFHNKPLPNSLRNSDATIVVDTGMPLREGMGSALETADPNLRPSWAAPRSDQNQNNSLMEQLEAKKKKRDSTMDSFQRLNSESSVGTLSMPPTGKRPTQKWTREEFAKLEELVNAEIRANDLRPEGSRLEGFKFFKAVSEQLRELGIERGAAACTEIWQRRYPKGNVVEREIIGGENDISVPEAPNTSKPGKALEASDLALRWGEDEKESLNSTVSESYLERKDEHGIFVMSSINWNKVENKHRANGYTRTLSSLKGQWNKQKTRLRPSIMSAPAGSDSEDDRPLSELRANRFKAVDDTVVRSLSFDKVNSNLLKEHRILFLTSAF